MVKEYRNEVSDLTGNKQFPLNFKILPNMNFDS